MTTVGGIAVLYQALWSKTIVSLTVVVLEQAALA